MNNTNERCYPYESGFLQSVLRSMVWKASAMGIEIKDEAKLKAWTEEQIKEAVDGGRKML